MKIVHLIADANTGGGQTYLLHLLHRFQHLPHEMIVICPKEGFYVEAYSGHASKVYRIDWSQPHHQLFFTLRRIFQTEQPDYIHNHLWKASFFGTLAAYVGLARKVFNHLHGDLVRSNFSKKLEFYFYLLLNFIFVRPGSHYVCISKFEQQLLQSYGISKQRSTVVYNGIDTSEFTPVYLPYSPQSDTFNILCVARLHPAKGIDTLLEASKLLPETVHLTIIGDGPLYEHLDTKIKQDGLKKVRLVGYKFDVRNDLAACHLFVLPSNWEGFGIAIAEAMATGKAVVATKVGGIPELILDGKGGFLCTPKKPEQLADCIKKIMHQPELIEAFGRFNRKRIEQHFSLTVTVAGIQKLYI